LPIIVAIFILEPLIIDPLFFKFEPLSTQQPELTANLQKLTQRAGLQIPRERMFLMNASAKPTNSMPMSPASAPPNAWSSMTTSSKK